MINKKIIKNIKLVATDIDGVWTDSKMYYTDSGEYMKGFSTYDGMATSLLKKNNIEIHARSIFLQGLLFLNPKDLDRRFDDVKPILFELSSIAKNDNLNLAELSLLLVNNLYEVV